MVSAQPSAVSVGLIGLPARANLTCISVKMRVPGLWPLKCAIRVPEPSHSNLEPGRLRR